jgi:hypothetical protein
MVEAAGVGAWGRTFQVWAVLISWGTYGGANGVSISQAHRLRTFIIARLNDLPTVG